MFKPIDFKEIDLNKIELGSLNEVKSKKNPNIRYNEIRLFYTFGNYKKNLLISTPVMKCKLLLYEPRDENSQQSANELVLKISSVLDSSNPDHVSFVKLWYDLINKIRNDTIRMFKKDPKNSVLSKLVERNGDVYNSRIRDPLKIFTNESPDLQSFKDYKVIYPRCDENFRTFNVMMVENKIRKFVVGDPKTSLSKFCSASIVLNPRRIYISRADMVCLVVRVTEVYIAGPSNDSDEIPNCVKDYMETKVKESENLDSNTNVLDEVKERHIKEVADYEEDEDKAERLQDDDI
jgi:hypothetical protein